MELMGIGGAFALLGILKPILEVLLYISLIFLSFKAIKALNMYINKNT